jgi:hypothetical protein
MSKTTFSGTGVNMTDTSIWSARKHKVCFKEERYDTRLWRDNVCGQVAELLAFLPRFSSKVSRKVLMKWSLPWNGLTKWLLQGEAGMSATSLPESLGTMVQTNGKRFQVSSSAYLWKHPVHIETTRGHQHSNWRNCQPLSHMVPCPTIPLFRSRVSVPGDEVVCHSLHQTWATWWRYVTAQHRILLLSCVNLCAFLLESVPISWSNYV